MRSSRFGLMLIPDYHKALTEIRRVFAKRWEGRRNGVLDPGQYPFLSIPHSIARRVEVWRYHRSLSGNSG